MSHVASIQALRAAAALTVAFGHLRNDAVTMPAASLHGFVAGGLDVTAAGVDLFFVISGFVMVYASRGLFEAPGGARLFLTRRIARIVPFYWALTSVYLLTMMLAPKALSSAAPTLTEIAKSYLFIPYWHDGAEMIQPVYKLGWTLNYEMFFYTVFAAVMVWPLRTAVSALAVGFTSLAVLGSLIAPEPGLLAFWTHPIILEFVMGAIIAMAFIEGVRLRRLEAVLLLGTALAVLAITSSSGLEAHAVTRPLIWGLPAAAIVAAAALVETSNSAAPRLRWAIALGDASYAIYLLHPLVVRGLRLVWDKTGASAGVHPWVFIVLGLALIVPLSLAVYRWFELPVTAATQRFLGVAPSARPGMVRA